MKNFYKLLLPIALLASCSEETGFLGDAGDSEPAKAEVAAAPGEMVLGEQLQNPYSVSSVEASLASLYPTRAGMSVEANCTYMRFLPKDLDEYALLEESGLELFDHPLDREILVEGDWWHDPSVPEESLTWQYATVPVGTEIPEGIECEVLDQCFLPELSETRAYSDIDWEAVECRSYELTGNEELLSVQTRAKTAPSGRIAIKDADCPGTKTVGVAGIKVIANTFIRIATTFTDENGKYTFSSKFSAKPHYTLCFKNEKGFSIGLNLILVPASVTSLGKGDPDGISITVDKSGSDALFRRCAVNNAAYDYYSACQKQGITLPPSNVRFWILGSVRSSSALMMHHGALMDFNLASKYTDVAKLLLRIMSPDITIGAKGKEGNYAALYESTVHELAHASHFQKVGTGFWSSYATYILTSFFTTGSCYGTGNGDNAGYCEVGEMWAYYVGRSFYKARYGVYPDGSDHWFHPEIFETLEAGGLSKSDICSVLTRNMTDVDALKSALTSAFPSKKTMITQAFKAYSL